jgi:16S rRNA U1498 N3-methylase RsmE
MVITKTERSIQNTLESRVDESGHWKEVRRVSNGDEVECSLKERDGYIHHHSLYSSKSRCGWG